MSTYAFGIGVAVDFIVVVHGGTLGADLRFLFFHLLLTRATYILTFLNPMHEEFTYNWYITDKHLRALAVFQYIHHPLK